MSVRQRVPRPVRFVLPFVLLLCLLAAAPSARAAKEPKKRVAVTAFENRAEFADRRWGDVGEALAEQLVEALIQTDKFVVLERLALRDILGEQNLDQLAPVSPEIQKRLTSAQALIRGVVTSIEAVDSTEAKVRLGKLRVGGGGSRVEVTVNIRVIDVITGQILQSKTVSGKAKKRGGLVQFRGKKNAIDAKGEQTVPIGKAVQKAVQDAVDAIVAGMESVAWQGSVVRVSGRQVFINAGQQENVEMGLRLKVYAQGPPLIDAETNEFLGTLDEEVGVIEIERVGPRFAIGQIVEGQGFARGNLVRPAGETLQ